MSEELKDPGPGPGPYKFYKFQILQVRSAPRGQHGPALFERLTVMVLCPAFDLSSIRDGRSRGEFFSDLIKNLNERIKTSCER
jgi:hypothetical protein